MAVMLFISGCAIFLKLGGFWVAGNIHLFSTGLVILVMVVWLGIEALIARMRPGGRGEGRLG